MKLTDGHKVKRLAGGPHVDRSQKRSADIGNDLVFFSAYSVEKPDGTYDCDVYIRPDFAYSHNSRIAVINMNSYDSWVLSYKFPDWSDGYGSRIIAGAFARDDYMNEWWQFLMNNGL